jgi:SWI/SNF-related matrix-associated actin-dependent regulator of chromatin subfamily A3
MTVKCNTPPVPQSDDSTISVSASGELFSSGSHFVGKFDEHGTQIVQALSDDRTLELQVVLPSKNSGSTIRKPVQFSSPLDLTASIIIYGPMDAHESVGNFFQECELYLQDPIGCDRNVPYHNPHRLGFASEPLRMTFDVCPSRMHIDVKTIPSHNPLDAIFSSDYVAECDTPSLLRTLLLPYVFPLLL